MRRHHEHVIAASIDAGVGHIVYTGIIDVSPDSRFYYAAVHRETEALLAAFDVGGAGSERGDARASGRGRWDVAGERRRGAGACRRRRLALRRDLELTGPAALTAGEISQIIESVTGGDSAT